MNRDQFNEKAQLVASLKRLHQQQRVACDELREDKSAEQKQLAICEARILSEIAGATDPETSKQLYSNAERRAAELIQRQHDSAEFNAIEETIAAIDRRIAAAINDMTLGSIEIECNTRLLDYELSHPTEEFDDALLDLHANITATVRAEVKRAFNYGPSALTPPEVPLSRAESAVE